MGTISVWSSTCPFNTSIVVVSNKLSPLQSSFPFLPLHRNNSTTNTRLLRFSTSLSSSSMATPLQVSASSVIGATNKEKGNASSGAVGENDLLIVGPGVLGRLVAEKWRQEHPDCQIYGQTVTTDHHEELINMGINPSLKGVQSANRYPYVIFCAPPSRSSDYPGDVRDAALSWNGEGGFLFTSSSAPYDRFDNGPCNEDSPIVPMGRSPRTDVLLKAEKVLTFHELSLYWLYKADRGAHTYWLQKGTVDVRPDHILNLIHYEDAASLAIAILKKKFRGRIFLGCDNHPVSRQEVMDLVAKSGKFSKKFEGFTGKLFFVA
ncbi:hypothetical protein Tsubulata_009599 [Turnera subulata]|uniref:NAD(P)-binding domain-containing protein n=1 Tax=Turnera subulata TaxID=218843 RepID=A0A9Q0F1D5_9ROSI|nr:hypothetical protein Tsubulata_009599 [Turnera subulata]